MVKIAEYVKEDLQRMYDEAKEKVEVARGSLGGDLMGSPRKYIEEGARAKGQMAFIEELFPEVKK